MKHLSLYNIYEGPFLGVGVTNAPAVVELFRRVTVFKYQQPRLRAYKNSFNSFQSSSTATQGKDLLYQKFQELHT